MSVAANRMSWAGAWANTGATMGVLTAVLSNVSVAGGSMADDVGENRFDPSSTLLGAPG